uniref:Uncharacterized protein n=1 Tax=Rhizophora mucronata TaxID=61149 RepID=A0A2P2N7N3_RHIMU
MFLSECFPFVNKNHKTYLPI